MTQKLVANELLAFLQQKLDVMDEVSAVQICATNFSEDDIAASKLQLYQLLNKSDKMVSRRRDGTKKSIQDIITLLKETDPDDVPTFVAKDLSKLPPVTFDHVDVTSLLKDINFLKASLAEVLRKLEASQSTVTDLRAELDELRNSVTLTGSPAARVSYVNTCRGAACLNASVASYASAVSPPAPIAESASRSSAPVPAAPPHNAARNKRPAEPLVNDSTSAAPPAKPVLVKAMDRAVDDGFVTVRRRKHRQRSSKNRCGQAPLEPNVKLRAAKPNTPVYISRLHYTTEVDDIVEYVRRKLNYTARVQLLESRRNVNFKAFVVRIPTCYLNLVLEESFWPQDVVFRRFRGPIPHDSTKT